MNEDRGTGAMPKLYGAPAYARPRNAGVESSGRPFDPDDLPIESQRTDIDVQLVQELAPASFALDDRTSPARDADEDASAAARGRGFPWRLPGRKG